MNDVILLFPFSFFSSFPTFLFSSFCFSFCLPMFSFLLCFLYFLFFLLSFLFLSFPFPDFLPLSFFLHILFLFLSILFFLPPFLSLPVFHSFFLYFSFLFFFLFSFSFFPFFLFLFSFSFPASSFSFSPFLSPLSLSLPFLPHFKILPSESKTNCFYLLLWWCQNPSIIWVSFCFYFSFSLVKHHLGCLEKAELANLFHTSIFCCCSNNTTEQRTSINYKSVLYGLEGDRVALKAWHSLFIFTNRGVPLV